MPADQVFERLVDIESRHVACRAQVIQNNNAETLRQRQKMLADFGACIAGPPRNSCQASLMSAEAAQIFFNEYYVTASRPNLALLEKWQEKCGRAEQVTAIDLQRIDLRERCSSSYLMIPIWYKRYISSLPSIRVFTRIYGDELCGKSATALRIHYGDRCNNIRRMGSAYAWPHSSRGGGLIREYYDQVDWDVCRVLLVGDVVTSVRHYGENVDTLTRNGEEIGSE
ncbi:MAG TPA: hypothetical protein VFS01_12500 [Rhizomicrobium sp.]|jgi:hypothetical protein|nr:hypothetical protein [Rhizomicrobium sp.]